MATTTGEQPLASAPRWLVACLLTLGTVTSCSGDDETLPTEPPVQPSDTTTTSTTSPTTLSPGSSAPTPPEPAPTTTTGRAPTTAAEPSSTSAPPATTQPPVTAESTDEDEVLALIEGEFAMWRDCIRSIPTCDTSGFDQFLAEPQLTGSRGQIAEAQANFHEAVNVDSLTYDVLEVRLDFTIPYVLICQRDAGSLIERRPGQPERVIEEGYVEKIREIQLVRTPDGWRIEGFATREESAGVEGALC